MRNNSRRECNELRDCGDKPFVGNINKLARMNPYFRVALWTGKHLQVTLMSIRVGGEIGWEQHGQVDQLLRVESGSAVVMIGDKCSCGTKTQVNEGCVIIIPAGTWHNVVNSGRTPLKLSSVYAPPQHPLGTVHETKEIADREH